MIKALSFILFSSIFLLVLSLSLANAASFTPPTQGAPTLVEYYDYACPHCRNMAAVIARLQAAYPQLNIIYRVTPLLTPQSKEIASFALAAKEEGKWQAVHDALMVLPYAPTDEDIKRIAMEYHFNTSMLFQTMQQPTIQQQIDNNIKLAETHALQGVVYLPLLVFKHSDGKGQDIILRGEQPYALLSAVVAELSPSHGQASR